MRGTGLSHPADSGSVQRDEDGEQPRSSSPTRSSKSAITRAKTRNTSPGSTNWPTLRTTCRAAYSAAVSAGGSRTATTRAAGCGKPPRPAAHLAYGAVRGTSLRLLLPGQATLANAREACPPVAIGENRGHCDLAPTRSAGRLPDRHADPGAEHALIPRGPDQPRFQPTEPGISEFDCLLRMHDGETIIVHLRFQTALLDALPTR